MARHPRRVPAQLLQLEEKKPCEFCGTILRNELDLEHHRQNYHMVSKHSFKHVLMKGVKDSTNNSKKLPQGIWSIKPITLNVSPGDKVSLDYIMMLTEPSCAKKFQELVEDKYVCIFMLPMSPMSLGHAKSTFLDAIMLRDVYEHIESSGGKFEVICVPTHLRAEDERNQLKFNYDDCFNPYPHHLEIKSCTPFTHIGINNACLERIQKTIGLPNYPEATFVILGPNGGSNRRVVSIFDSDFLNWHGAEAYPFTIEKVQQLAGEDEALRRGKLDLRTLLSTTDRDFLILNDCTKVPISDLKQKTVCLLFYEVNWECRKRTEELKQVYKANKDFEVVVVFAITFGHDTTHLVEEFEPELKFWKVFCDMPWLAVPFDDPKCRQLWRVFNRTKMSNDSYAPKLIIVYSEGKYFEENGFQVLEETKFKSYPFTGKELVQNAVGVRRKTLSSVLGQNIELHCNEVIYDWDCQYGGAGKEKYEVSDLFGAPVALLFLRVSGFSEFLSELQSYHSVGRISMGKFEVVYVPMMKFPDPDPYSWMLFSPSAKFNQERLIPLFADFFEDEITQNPEKKFTMALVTFGPFGHYSGRGIMYTNSSEDAHKLFLDTFPFGNSANKEFFESLHSATPTESSAQETKVLISKHWADVSDDEKDDLKSKINTLALDELKNVNNFLEDPEPSSIQVVTSGDTLYTSAKRFEDLNLSAELLQGLYVEMKFERPSNIQAITLPMILTPPHKNLIVQAHNCSGKTTCFVLGMLSRVDPKLAATQALCICPTRELAMQNQEVLERMGKFTGISSILAIPMEDMPSGKRPPVNKQVVIGTLGTIIKWFTARKLRMSAMNILVFDEADYMLADGGFIQESVRIMNGIVKIRPNCQVLLSSATFNDAVESFTEIVKRIFVNEYNQLFVKKELSLDSLKQYKVYCHGKFTKIRVVKDILDVGQKVGQTIIFVRRKNSAIMLEKSLVDYGYEVTAIHGALKPKDRYKIVKKFKEGLTKVLISTDLARGFQGQVNLVVNYDLPLKFGTPKPDYEVYLYRIGRAGRFGHKGAVFNLLGDEGDMLMTEIENHFNSQVMEVVAWKSDEVLGML